MNNPSVASERNIEKASAAELMAQKSPYTSIGNKTVEMITNPDALAIWAYLQTRAPGWKVIGSFLQDHFGMGRVRYRKAMKYLSEIGLMSKIPVRDENGQMAGTRIIIHYQPKVSKHDPSAPRVQVSDRSESARLGETTPYVIKDFINQEIDNNLVTADAVTGSGQNRKADQIPYQAICDAYNRICGSVLPKCIILNDKRRSAMKKIWNLSVEGDYLFRDLESWEGYFERALENDHWRGSNDRGWTANLDFLLREANVVRVLEAVA